MNGQNVVRRVKKSADRLHTIVSAWRINLGVSIYVWSLRVSYTEQKALVTKYADDIIAFNEKLL